MTDGSKWRKSFAGPVRRADLSRLPIKLMRNYNNLSEMATARQNEAGCRDGKSSLLLMVINLLLSLYAAVVKKQTNNFIKRV